MTLRDLTNATLGFEALAAAIDCPSKSVHRMLSARGNPSTQNLCAIFYCAVSASGRHARVRCKADTAVPSRHVGITHAATDDAGLA